MDVTTLNQLISVGGVLVSTWLGLQVKNAYEKENFSRKAISKAIVSDVFVPLLDVLYPYNRYSTEEQRKMLLNLIHTQRALIPPVVLKQMEIVLENEDSEEHKHKLLIVSESLFNCYRKKIGYPYSSEMINNEFTPGKELRDKIIMISTIVLGALWILSAGYTAIGVYYLLQQNFTDNISVSWVALIPVMFTGFGIPIISINRKS